jgi:hypothetical protein
VPHLQADDAAAQDQHALGYLFQGQRARAVHHARVFGHEGQAHGLAAGGDDGALECDDLLGAGLLLPGAGGFFHLDVVGADEMAVTAHGGHLAHLGHRAQPTRELADDLFLVAAQLVDVDHGYAEVHAKVAQVADLVHHGGHVQQRLGRDAAHVQADAAQRGVAFDDHDFQAQVRRAERRRVAARAAAEHQHVALQVGRAAEGGRDGGGEMIQY